ncbi:hypothetical protein Tco_0007873 [Tanacetum coccineum]
MNTIAAHRKKRFLVEQRAAAVRNSEVMETKSVIARIVANEVDLGLEVEEESTAALHLDNVAVLQTSKLDEKTRIERCLRDQDNDTRI